MSKSPHIRTYVHDLLITGSLDLNESSTPIFSALNDLPSLHSLQIRPSTHIVITRKPQISLTPILESKSLTSLELSCFDNFPAQLLYHCAALRNLAIRRVTFQFPSKSDMDNESIVLRPERPMLKSLILSTQDEGGSDTLTWFMSELSPFDFSQLETFIGLDRCNETISYEIHCKFISHVSRSLKTILIDPISRSDPDPLSPLDPQQLQKISNMTVSLVQDAAEEESTLPWLIALLSGLPNPDSLHDLTLLCGLYGHSTHGLDFYSIGWSEVDALLARCYNLKKVHIKSYDEPDDQAAGELIPWFEGQLPTLANKGILSIECSTDVTYTEGLERQLMG